MCVYFVQWTLKSCPNCMHSLLSGGCSSTSHTSSPATELYFRIIDLGNSFLFTFLTSVSLIQQQRALIL